MEIRSIAWTIERNSFYVCSSLTLRKCLFMSYPMQNLYLTEMEYEKDMDRMKELYPRDVPYYGRDRG